jgi:hypothetical protein
MGVVAKVDEQVSTEAYMHTVTANMAAPTAVTLNFPCSHIMITANGIIDVSFDSSTIVAGATRINNGEFWAMDLACTTLAVQSVAANGVIVRIQILREY